MIALSSAWAPLPGGVSRGQLDSGVTLLLRPQAAAEAVALQLWVAAGSAVEGPEEHGVAHFLEHMLFRGTARRGVGEVSAEIESVGGEVNAWTSFDATVLHAVVPPDHLATAVDVLGDALTHSLVSPDDLERERDVVLEEIRQGMDDPERLVAHALFGQVFAGHPYGRSVIGDADAVRGHDRDRLMAFHRRWYVGGNVTAVVAGRFEPARARALLAEALRDLPGRRRPTERRTPMLRSRGERAAVTTLDVGEVHLALGFPLPAADLRARAALDIAATAVGQGEASRLGLRLHRDRELVSSAHAYVHPMRDASLFVVGATLPSGRYPEAARALASEVARLRDEPLDPQELQRARRAIVAESVFAEELAEGVARQIGESYLTAGDPDHRAAYTRLVHEISAEEVSAAAVEFLSPERSSSAALLPSELTGNSEVSRLRARGKLGRLVAEGLSHARRSTPDERSEIVDERLPSGMRVIIRRQPGVPLVAARAVWSGGLLRETPARAGAHQALADLITRGCGKRSAEDVFAEVEASAAVLSGFAGRNSFGLRAEWLAADWQPGLDLLADCILQPALADDEVARYKRRALEDLVLRQENPTHLVFRRFVEALYQKHPYRVDPLGTDASIRALSSRGMRDFYRRHYPVSALTLAIVGDVNPRQVLRRIRDRFGKVRGRARPGIRLPKERFSGRSTAERHVFHYLEREQAHVVIGFPGLTVDDGDRYALEVMTSVLAGQGGRLFVELRDKSSFAYRIGALSSEGLDPGYVVVYFSCAPEKVDAAVRVARQQLHALREQPISTAELERARGYLIGANQLARQQRAAVAGALAFHGAYGLDLDEYDRYAERIRGISIADVRRVARRLLDPNLEIIATVMPRVGSPAADKRMRGTRRRPGRRR